jgi:hypothetical protein
LLVEANNNAERAPLMLLLAAACQAEYTGGGGNSIVLTGQLVDAARRLTLSAEIIAARSIARRSDRPGRQAIVGTDLYNGSKPSGHPADLHAVAWVPTFGVLADVGVFLDNGVRDLLDDLHLAITSPVTMKVANLESLLAANGTPGIRRGPLQVGWDLYPAATQAVTAVLRQHAETVERGGQYLAYAALDLLLAADLTNQPEPVLDRLPSLRALLRRHETQVNARAGRR